MNHCVLRPWMVLVNALGLAFQLSAAPPASMNVTSTEWGRTSDGTQVHLFTLSNPSGVVAKVTSYGVIVTELHVPDRHGQAQNVVLGFDNLERYLQGHPAFGATIGRVANRIAQARFTLEGKEYKLAANNGRNTLHGGLVGFDKKVWKARVLPTTASEAAVEFSLTSPDGDEGFPGTMEVTVKVTLTSKNELRFDYRATTDKTTLVNLTNHSYFNLAGSGDVLGHELQIFTDRYTVSDSELIPTGEIASVKGTPLDFTKPHTIGERIDKLRPNPNGYDHNFLLPANTAGKMTLAARAHEPKSGRVLEVLTTEPGVQLYTANGLDGKMTGVGGVVYPQHAGFCLETQHPPDAIHHPEFPSVILRPGAVFQSSTVFRFAKAH